MRKARYLKALAAAALALAVAGGGAARALSRPHFADAADAVAAQRGRAAYRRNCASCHGRYLEGQPLWQIADVNARRRAPALDSTGRAWERDDETLFRIVKSGRLPGMTETERSFMPAFGNRLGDGDILDILAFVKARLPIAMRVMQALQNPGHAGMPKGADSANWTFPLNCDGGRVPAKPSGFEIDLTPATR